MSRMDEYTAETRRWLDKRFRQTDSDGIYFAHQPIYGFRAGHCEDSIMRRYVITHAIMNALGGLEFKTLLDVGGAEGYKAALARHFFGAQVRSCDLSAEASARAKQIFDVDADTVDSAELPYGDGSYDVVLCSETLEHVSDIRGATRELLRVARSAVVITVPKESPEEVERNIREKVPHGHIHALDLDSFDWVASEAASGAGISGGGVRVIPRRISSRGLLSMPMKIVEAEPALAPKHSTVARLIYNHLLRPVFKLVFGKRTAAFLLESDNARSAARSNSRGLLFVIVKNSEALKAQPVRIPARAVLDFQVPLHRPQLPAAIG